MHSGRKFLFVTHNVLSNAKLFFRAYPDGSIVHIVRNPVDLVFSWNRKGYGNNIDTKFIDMNPSIVKDMRVVPWYMCDWIDDLENMNTIDVVIKSIYSLYERIENELDNIDSSYKSRIHFVKYEDIVMNTLPTVKMLGESLGCVESPAMGVILAREQCPNGTIMDNHRDRRMYIYDKASIKYQLLLDELDNKYSNSSPYTT